MTNLLRYVKVLLVFVCVSASGTAFADICDGCEEYQPPIAVDDVATTNENTPVTINVLANDINPYNGPLYIDSFTLPNHGSVVVNAPNVTYTPNFNFSGADSFSYTISDNFGPPSTAIVRITVVPVNHSPICDAASPSRMYLWPPDHEFFDVQVEGVTDPDGDPLTIAINGIYQDEPVSGKGSGNTSPDGMLSTDVAAIRAERDGSGDGRVYHIVFVADDGQGGTCTGEVMVSVPHDQSGAPAVDGTLDGDMYDSTGTP